MAKHYTVDSVTERYLPTRGGFEKHMVVAFVHDSGYRGTVDIPAKLASADAVKTAIEAEVARISAILSL